MMTRTTTPTSGYVSWPNPEPAYPMIKPNHPYEIQQTENGVFINIHSGFLGLEYDCLHLNNGEITEDVLNRAVFS